MDTPFLSLGFTVFSCSAKGQMILVLRQRIPIWRSNPDAHLHAHALIEKQLSIAREQHHKYWWDDMLDSESTEKETPTFAIQQQPARLQGGPPSLAVLRGETNNSSSDLHQAEALVLSQKLQTGVVTSIEGDAQYQPEQVMVQHYEARRSMPHRIQSCSERGSTNFTLTQDSLVKQSAGLSDVVTYDSDSNSDSNPPTPKMRQHAVAGQRAAESSLLNSDRRLSELWAHDYSPTLPQCDTHRCNLRQQCSSK